ncbi:hypothetical protein PF010_g14979 [Phytophthora fragariae]|uniref:Uncharacterized protein n=1 Tax=Phytophthora fragariae TaxID=53985 RepID=A0A6A3ISF4_9STRA|nr:hypothetical protein PF009_g16374 [Phytophthora fragariae]KAE8982393.1 hypothetical protein PF011_g21636 [Phytophthora fragariae]KAE9099989.1 hypothetical protein PF010_g14979 [Phytophthora fragariae]KAE9099996.1 hypothetical protein PF007_g15677 [Phytophthora fragariae]KAE9186143.1 hypothetical protein PF004_g23169 [Phytophthora fragariae]
MASATSHTARMSLGVSEIASVVDTVKLKKPRNVNATSNTSNPSDVNLGNVPTYASTTSQVAFVRLKRSGKCDNIVLTHAEKYNISRSVFDPVLDRLMRLSSARFYKQIQYWEEVITKFTDREQPASLPNHDNLSHGVNSADSESETDFEDDYLLELADILEADDEINAILATSNVNPSSPTYLACTASDKG